MSKPLIAAGALVAVSLAAFAAAQTAKPVSRAEFLRIVDGRFNSLDTNHDGKLSKEELAAEQQKELAAAKARLAQQLQANFKRLDTNKDGQLSLQEYMAGTPAIRSSETPEQLMARLDANHDGKVTPDEFRAPDVAKFNRADTNHDGIVTPQEARAAAGGK